MKLLFVTVSLLLLLLNVRPGASSVLAEPNNVAIKNETIVLSCTVQEGNVIDGHWEKDGKRLDGKNSKLAATSLTYTIEKPETSDAGSYRCIIKTSNGEQAELINVIAMPKIVPHKKHYESRTDGETARIKCVASGFPAFNWTWFSSIKGVIETVENGTDRREVHTHGNHTMLIISTVDSEKDQGNYTCRATNSFGSDEMVVAVRIHNRMASVWIFLGLVVEVLVLITIIFIYEKRTTKKEAVIQEDEPKPLKSSVQSDKEDGVRQRN